MRAASQSPISIVGTPSRIVVRVWVISSSVAPAGSAGRRRLHCRRGVSRRRRSRARARGRTALRPARRLRSEPERARGVVRRRPEAAVRQDRALRLAGRSRREEDDCRAAVLRFGERAQQLGRMLELPFVVDEQARTGDLDARLDLGPASRTLSGTATAPIRSTPRKAATNAGPFGSTSATRSPARPLCMQARCGDADATLELGVGQGPGLADERRSSRRARRDVTEPPSEVHTALRYRRA